MNVFLSDIESSSYVMVEEGLGSPDYKTDITEYDYQRKYFFTKYKTKENDFIFHTFLLIGAGQSYNQETGNICYRDVSYIEDLETEKGIDNKFDDKVYTLSGAKFMLDKITYLNTEWLNAFEKLVKIFNENEVLSQAFNDDKERQKNEYTSMVKYLNKKLKSLKK